MDNQSESASATEMTFLVSPSDEGARVDSWLTKLLPDHSRTEIQRWIKSERVTMLGMPVRASHKLETGQSFLVRIPEAASDPTAQPQAIPLDIIYEDEDCIVVDKSAGMVVHPAPGHPDGTLVNAVLYHCPNLTGVGGEIRPGIVHRLDRDTSGLIVVAKNDRAHRYLQQQFRDRTVYKEYLTLVEGELSPERGRISAPIGRHPVDRKRQAVLLPDPVNGVSSGREAITEYEVLAYLAALTRHDNAISRFTYLRVVLKTGRTHQIRVHLAWLKRPVVGDTIYGYRRPRLQLARHFLHAHQLHIRLPGDGEVHRFVSDLPADLQRALDVLQGEDRKSG